MIRQTLGFIGCGNMARSLIGGLIARGAKPQQIIAADPAASQREAVLAQFGVRATSSNAEVAAAAQVLVLAVKPQEMRTVATGVEPAVRAHRPAILSVAAGIRSSDLQSWLGGLPVVRCMPNSPALNGCGVTGLFATAEAPQSHRDLAEEIMGAVGPAVWVEKESQMDAVTAVSGSGPAYFFLLIEMLEEAGVSLGLPPDVSRRLAIETAYGAGQMAHAAAISPGDLRRQVTSKGGTTEAAVNSMEAAHMRKIFIAAVSAAAHRSAEMADQFGKQ